VTFHNYCNAVVYLIFAQTWIQNPKRISCLTHPLTHSTKIITTESEREREEGELGFDAEREKNGESHANDNS
jgi:hypothetical protein